MLEADLETEDIRVIRLGSRFVFPMHQAFRKLIRCAIADPAVGRIQIDMHEVEHIDGAALGMLLLLRDNALATGKKVTLASPRGKILGLLLVWNFQKLFEIT